MSLMRLVGGPKHMVQLVDERADLRRCLDNLLDRDAHLQNQSPAAQAASSPCRRLAAPVSGEVRNRISARASLGFAERLQIPAENKVSLWMPAGNSPSTSTPGTSRSSLNC